MARQDPADSAPVVELMDGLVSLSRAMVGMSARALAQVDADVTLAQYRALVVLAGGGPQRSADVARELGVAPSTMTRMCDRLVRKQLVGRYHRGDDRRAVWIVLTDEGKALIGEVMRIRRAEITELVARAGIDGDVPVREALHRFVAAAGEAPEQQWWRRWSISTALPADAWPAQPAELHQPRIAERRVHRRPASDTAV